MVSLGCPKNRVDSELIAGRLAAEGCTVTGETASADVLVINTCGFIGAALNESIREFRRALRRRQRHSPNQVIMVVGCAPQFLGAAEAAVVFNGADVIAGVIGPDRIPAMLETALEARGRKNTRRAPHPDGAAVMVPRVPGFLHDSGMPRLRFWPPHSMYVKIAEGCSHGCTYCAIPRIRGRLRSRPPDDIVRECEAAVARGVKELVLVAQDTTAYGRDITRLASAPGDSGQSADLARLLQRLDRIPGRFWIRLMYTHPAHWTDELIRTLAAAEKVVPYVDIPLQHINDVILRRMRRNTTRAEIERLIRRLREAIPGITLRTTFMVGFPGETAEIFEELVQFVLETRFERLGAFKFCAVPGTAASRLDGQVPERVKAKRLARLMEVQLRVAMELNARMVGRQLCVLAEMQQPAAEIRLNNCVFAHPHLPDSVRHGTTVTVCRSHADAPEVDTNVYVPGKLTPGEFHTVKVIGWTGYDLVAVPA